MKLFSAAVLVACLGTDTNAADPTLRVDRYNGTQIGSPSQLQTLDTTSLTPLNGSVADQDSFIVGGTLARKGDFRK